MYTSPLVSVVIPTYNYASFLPEAVQSVLAQTFTDFEIIVVDGGSTDNTREVVAEFGDQIRYIYSPSPNPNNSRNVGILAAKGCYIALLDADDKWLPEKLALQVSLLESSPRVGLVYAGVYLFESETGAVVGYHPLGRCHRGRVLRELYRWQFVPSPTPLIRREVFEKVGLFDEQTLGADDWEMWLRIAAHYELDFVPRSLALYRVHPSAAGKKSAEQYEQDIVTFFIQSAKKYPELRPLLAWRLSSFAEGMGWRLVRAGESDAGRVRLRRAIQYHPFRPSPYLRLFLVHLMGNIRREDFQAAQATYLQGRHHLFNLRLKDARACFSRAIRINPLVSKWVYMEWVLTLGGERLVRRAFRGHPTEAYASASAPSDRITFQQW